MKSEDLEIVTVAMSVARSRIEENTLYILKTGKKGWKLVCGGQQVSQNLSGDTCLKNMAQSVQSVGGIK